MSPLVKGGLVAENTEYIIFMVFIIKIQHQSQYEYEVFKRNEMAQPIN